MKKVNQVKRNDLIYGDIKEKDLLPVLEDYFKVKLTKLGEYNEFDFVNKEKKILVELKSRRITKDQYPSTMIGYNKIEKGFDKIEEGYSIYFVFCFLDVLSYYELELVTYNHKWVSIGGRTDRGKVERKDYCYIPTSGLRDIGKIEGYEEDLGLQNLTIKTVSEKTERIIPTKITFGKYKGWDLKQIALKDKRYLKWVTEQSWCKKDLKNGILAVLN
jgi:uncharacterized protein (DUF3820 family)